MQVLKDEYGMSRSKVNQLLCGLLGKGTSTIALSATKPFEKATHRAGVFLLCLAGRVFGLQTGTGFRCASVLDLDGFSTHKERVPIRINRNERVRLVEVNAHGKDTLGFWDIQREGDSSQQVSIPLHNRDAINLFGTCKPPLKIFWDGIVQMLAPCHRPDRERPIRAKVRITPTFPDEE